MPGLQRLIRDTHCLRCGLEKLSFFNSQTHGFQFDIVRIASPLGRNLFKRYFLLDLVHNLTSWGVIIQTPTMSDSLGLSHAEEPDAWNWRLGSVSGLVMKKAHGMLADRGYPYCRR